MRASLIAAPLCVVTAMMPQGANAQIVGNAQAAARISPVTDPAAAVDGAGADTGEIIVTAQRRAERMTDVPITMTNLDSDALTRDGVKSLADIGSVMSGLRFDTRGGSAQATIRGVGTSIALAGAASNVGIYVDGFNAVNPLSTDFQLLNVENIQVLKGPQGTLFGRNTTAGAILVTTSKPSTATKAIVEASYGSYNTQQIQGYATTGLSDRVAVDVAAILSKGDGFVTNLFTNDDKVGRYRNWSVRVGLNIDLTDNFSALFRYNHSHVNDPQDILYGVYSLNGVPIATAASTNAPGAIIATKRGTIAADDPVIYRSATDWFQGTLSWDLGFATLTSYTQYRKDSSPQKTSSTDLTNLKQSTLNVEIYAKTFTQELLLASKPGTPLQWTTGLFYFDYNDRWISQTATTGPLLPNLDTGVNPKSMAAYADVTYELTDKLFFTGGIRYTHDKTVNAFFATTTARTDFPALKTNRLTPRAVVRYKLNALSNVFASFSRGYKAAIYNVGGLTTVPIKPESLSAFEVGYKYSDPKLSFNLSSYYYKYKDQQLSSSQMIGTIRTSLINNAASSTIYGVDGDIRYKFSRAFDANVSASWNHARYGSFPTSPLFVQASNGTYSSFPSDASGFHMLRSPDFTATAGARYSADLAGGELVLSSNLYYTSKFYFDAAQQVPQKSYTTVGLRAEWTDKSDRFTFAVYGNNVTDAKYYSQASYGTRGALAVWAWPATIGASVRVKMP